MTRSILAILALGLLGKTNWNYTGVDRRYNNQNLLEPQQVLPLFSKNTLIQSPKANISLISRKRSLS